LFESQKATAILAPIHRCVERWAGAAHEHPRRNLDRISRNSLALQSQGCSSHRIP
jgi:hypothetical protein